MGILSGKALGLIVLFTIIETIVLTMWLVLLGVPVDKGVAVGTGAATVLFLGLFIEHIIAAISNKV